MDSTLRILHVEDSEADVMLLSRHLTTAGYRIVSDRVDTADAMEAALAACEWDIILCDYSMPTFNAIGALKTLHSSGLDIPLIIISGTVGEEIAVEAMLTGANDYLPKDNLKRLVPTIERELHAAENRRRQRRAEEERRLMFEIIQGGVSTPNLDEFLKLVHRSIRQVVYAENCFVMLNDPVTKINRFAFWVDKMASVPDPKPIGKGFASYVLRTSEALLLTDEVRAKLRITGEAEQPGGKPAAWLGAPLRTSSGTIGVLVVQHYENKDAYDQLDLEFLASVGDQIALAIERKRTEVALSDSEERYRELVENAIDMIYSHDLEGNYTSVNRAAEEITGYTREETLSMNLIDSVAPEYLTKAKEMIAAKMAGKDIAAYEIEIISKDGRRVALEVNTRIIFENGNPIGVQGIARNITERKQLEQQFMQSQKMEAVGLLAGGIAHDFNNLLTAINGYSALTLKQIPDEDPIRHNIEMIYDAGDRAAALTGQLLAFSRKQVMKPRVHNLNTVIIEIERMLRRIIKENVEFRTALDPSLGNIRADPGQIEQVIMNLAVNARDAMPNGGTLTIETKNVYLDDNYVSQHLLIRPGPFVKMIVTDTGKGIDEATKKRIFEPFFTTKETGKGTGLGLSTVHGIVKQSGGDIMVYSEVGIGTTFKIYLPCVDENVQRPKWVDGNKANLAGNETILLVEDEEVVRSLVKEILVGNGYNVLEAASGSAAIALCEKHCEDIQLLLTDVVMPKMGGAELREHVVKHCPRVKVLFMSGYTDDAIASHGLSDSEIPFIEKPFTPDGLLQKVREVLEF